jgi:hypothetical protein
MRRQRKFQGRAYLPGSRLPKIQFDQPALNLLRGGSARHSDVVIVIVIADAVGAILAAVVMACALRDMTDG